MGARSSQEQPGAARSSQKQPEAARSSQQQPEADRSSQEHQEAVRSSQGQPGATRRAASCKSLNPSPQILKPQPNPIGFSDLGSHMLGLGRCQWFTIPFLDFCCWGCPPQFLNPSLRPLIPELGFKNMLLGANHSCRPLQGIGLAIDFKSWGWNLEVGVGVLRV